MRDIEFRKMLAKRQKEANSLLCVGLDPLIGKLPQSMGLTTSEDWEKIVEHMVKIVNATAEHVCMFKPNRAFYEGIPEGERALKEIIAYIHSYHAAVPVFLDCKRGDIANTQQQYSRAHFELDGADGVNFSPYMGKDCMYALIDKNYPGRALVGLCYTSNPEAREVQDLLLSGEDREYGVDYLWQKIARLTMKWAEECGVPGVLENAGLVMAAAYEKPKGSKQIFSNHLSACRKIVGDKLWFLIPGIGTQGGYVEETVRASFVGFGSIAVNISGEIDFASQEDDFAEKAAQKAEERKEQLWAAIPNEYILAAYRA